MGTSTAGTSFQGSTTDGETNENFSHNQARLQAAASAALLYQKCFVYPYPNILMWSPGYAWLPRTFGYADTLVAANDGAGGDANGLSQHYQLSDPMIAQLQQLTFVPSQFPCINGQFGAGSALESQLDMQRKLIKQQIEFLQNQFQLLQSLGSEKTRDLGSSDVKGKSVSTPSSYSGEI